MPSTYNQEPALIRDSITIANIRVMSYQLDGTYSSTPALQPHVTNISAHKVLNAIWLVYCDAERPPFRAKRRLIVSYSQHDRKLARNR